MEIINADCLEAMRGMPDDSVDSVVTDPPYGLKFMGKKWDCSVPSVEIWKECLRVLKPGGHLLAFAGTRTQHRMAVNIEDAGFEIRDMIAWVYGSGFPKSLDVSKAIDRAAGLERPRVQGGQGGKNEILGSRKSGEAISGEAISGEAIQWNGWGTALKPALEPITVARKPLTGTVASNVLEWGTGAINVDKCRVTSGEPSKIIGTTNGSTVGRWPSNLIHDGSEEVTGLFPGDGEKSAARFFYCAKASKADRDGGCEGMELHTAGDVTGGRTEGSAGLDSPRAGAGRTNGSRNFHPTVKPTDLMRYLCRLVTPPGGTILDPFVGSGSTGKAAALEGFDFVGIDLDPAYCEIARARIEAARPVEPLPLPAE